ncbi:mediator of RNA polymerase II transcription subunit 7-like isoform X2 [Dermacentor andersoni]|uniref:mediator of RNA polymerase II transcription subunit 7-like isoform X2 n=1 Tax=Dermacentor andersoni TaxID=34620 RepID=UPI0021559C62|nr:mediator of RNA polymerase II transcription subunit 7-like isoform X2 [Dermacentor andersoni]
MGEATQVSSLPLPPMQYVSLYTDENVQRGRAPSPPRPLHEGYSMFGAPFHGDEPVIRPLESQGIRRLYPQNYEHKKELKKLNHSLLVNFLDMVDILIRCPDTSKRLEKKDDMSLLFIHMHHLINEYRPHQARETLRVMLDMQRRQRLDTAHRFHKHLDKLTGLDPGEMSGKTTAHSLHCGPHRCRCCQSAPEPSPLTRPCCNPDKGMCMRP